MTDAYNLLDESYTTVAVHFLNDDEGSISKSRKTYNYKVPKTWMLAKDDFLVVEATSTMRIVQIDEVHTEPQFNGLPNLKWAIQKIDMAEHQMLKEREQKFRDALQQVERQRAKDELVAEMQRQAAGSSAASLMLGDALASIGATPLTIPPCAPGHPPAPEAMAARDPI